MNWLVPNCGETPASAPAPTPNVTVAAPLVVMLIPAPRTAPPPALKEPLGPAIVLIGLGETRKLEPAAAPAPHHEVAEFGSNVRFPGPNPEKNSPVIAATCAVAATYWPFVAAPTVQFLPLFAAAKLRIAGTSRELNRRRRGLHRNFVNRTVPAAGVSSVQPQSTRFPGTRPRRLRCVSFFYKDSSLPTRCRWQSRQ